MQSLLRFFAVFLLGFFVVIKSSDLKHANPISKDALIGQTVTDNVSNSTEFTYWFSGNVPGGIDSVTINIHSSVDSSVDNPVRFDIQWKDMIDQPPRTWILPLEAIDGNNRTVYLESNRTLCTDINDNNYAYLQDVVVKVVVSTLSPSPVNFTLRVYFGESNIISDFNQTRQVDLTLYSPVYFKLKISEWTKSQFALLDIWSDDESCITVALQSPVCPLIERERDADLSRHLTMSKNAAVTIEMSALLEGRFLVFVMHVNDSKCRSDKCDGCWKDEILPTSLPIPGPIQQKQLHFKLREKITNNQYIFSTVLSTGLLLSIVVLFPIVFCVVQRRREKAAKSNPSPEPIITAGYSRALSYEEQSQLINGRANEDDDGGESQCFPRPPQYRFIFFQKSFDTPSTATSQVDHHQFCQEEKKKSAQRYFGTLMVNAVFYILPAFQLIWIYQRFFKFTGNEDICYFNFRCLHSLWGIPAFNHLFSNVGYIFMGFLFLLVLQSDRNRGNVGLFKAMGVSLMVQGLMSGLYHTCPNHISFQFDTCFMYVTAMICCSHIYQKQHPDTTASATATYALVATAVALGVGAVFSRVKYFWIGIIAVHIIICLLVSLQLDSIHGGYRWKFVWPWRKTSREILSSICRPLQIETFSWVKGLLVCFNVINWIVAGVDLWVFKKSQDFATHLLVLFIVNLFLFSAVYLKMKINEKSISILASCFLVATIPTWCLAFYYYINETASWGVTPAESRMLNEDCIMFHFFDNHDIWHFLSGFGMFLNFMFFYTLEDSLSTPVNKCSLQDDLDQTKEQSTHPNQEDTPT